MKPPAALLAFVLASMATLLSAESVRVTAARANLRSGPGTGSPVLGAATQGTVLEVLGHEGQWIKVRLPATGAPAYVFATLTEAVPEAPPPPVASAPPPPPAATGPLDIAHTPAECLLAERFPRMEACVTPVADVAQVRAFFRSSRETTWYHVDLKPEDSCFAGILPKPSRALKEMRYYIEARDTALVARQTSEYSAVVVKEADDCGKRRLAPYVAGGTVVVGSLTAGASAVPAGFLAEGVVSLAGAGTTTTAAASAPVQAGAGASKILLIAGGVAAAGVGVAVAAGGGSGSDTSSGGTGGSGSNPPPATSPVVTQPPTTAPPTLQGTWEFDLRCQGQSTDAASTNIDLDQTSGGTFSGSSRGTDYTGEKFTLHLSGTFDARSGSLQGQFQAVFASGTRVDTFATVLHSSDSGYFPTSCQKNCACPAEMRLLRLH